MAGELLDTHVLVRWLGEPERLSKEQMRVLVENERRRQPFQVSAMTLIELAQMLRAGPVRMPVQPDVVLRMLDNADRFRILPITLPIAHEFGVLFAVLRDPADTAIVATARVHGLRLLTSDDRIIKANVVSTID